MHASPATMTAQEAEGLATELEQQKLHVSWGRGFGFRVLWCWFVVLVT